MGTEWVWRVTYQTARVAGGRAPDEHEAMRRASAEHARLVVKGLAPDCLAYHVEPVRAREGVV